MNLYEKLAIVENKIAALEEGLGLPQRRYLLVRYTVTDPTTRAQSIEDSLITPKAYITSVPPKFVNLPVAFSGASTITISINDLLVEIPRVYPITLFNPEGNTRAAFILDPLVVNGAIVYSNPTTKAFNNPKVYRLVYVDDSDPTIYKIILTKSLDKL